MSSYDEYLHELKETQFRTAKEALRRLYVLLVMEDENMSKEDMYDRIMKDCLSLWARETIRINMPDELKDTERQDAGKKGNEKKKEIAVTNYGNVALETNAKQSSDLQKEQESGRSHLGLSRPKSDDLDFINDAKKEVEEEDEVFEEDDSDQVEIQKPNQDTDKDLRIKELEEALKKTELFKTATDLPKQQSAAGEITLDYSTFRKMFPFWRSAKFVYLKHDGKKVVALEPDYDRKKEVTATT